MNFESRSQAGQDSFAFKLLAEPTGKTDGTFLDIGASHPIEKNNTYALEQLGWSGWLIELDENAAKLCERERLAVVLHKDATKFDYECISGAFERLVDYMSLDCDHASLDALYRVLSSPLLFRVITIEHDKYRFGPDPQSSMRRHLTLAGYELICGDVKDMDLPFEDWYVHPDRVDMKIADKFRSDGLSWQEVIAKA